MMIVIERNTYDLMLSKCPCEMFDYFGVSEMHGLNADDCRKHPNTSESSYIAGWSNYYPKDTNRYTWGDRRFVYINLSRCNDDVETTRVVFHELLHHSIDLHHYDINKEEEIITWADYETAEIVKIIKPIL